MVELSKFQIAAVKRTASTVKPYFTKVEKLNSKIAELQQQITELEDLIDKWEAPVREMTGGYSSSQYLHYLENGFCEEDSKSASVEENNFNIAEDMNIPIGNPSFPEVL